MSVSSTPPTKRKSRSELLISGYIHESENTLDLSMNMPRGIIQIVTSYWPSIIPFGIYSKTHFEVSERGTILKGHNKHTCSGYMVYAETYDSKGYNAGVHLWSVKSLSKRSSACYQSIGVTTTVPTHSVIERRTSHWPNESCRGVEDSYYSGYNEKWAENQTISVALNCNDWTVTYFKGTEKIRQDNIKKNKSYYFALSCCAAEPIVHLQVVEFPGHC